MKRLWVAATISLAIFGCAHRVKNVTDLPAGVAQSQVQRWDSAVANLKTVAASTSSVRQAVAQLHSSGVFPDGAAYALTLMDLGKADQLEIEAAVFLESVPNDWTLSTQNKVTAYMQQIQVLLTDMVSSGITGIKDQASQQNVNALIKTVGDAVALIVSLTQ